MPALSGRNSPKGGASGPAKKSEGPKSSVNSPSSNKDLSSSVSAKEIAKPENAPQAKEEVEKGKEKEADTGKKGKELCDDKSSDSGKDPKVATSDNKGKEKVPKELSKDKESKEKNSVHRESGDMPNGNADKESDEDEPLDGTVTIRSRSIRKVTEHLLKHVHLDIREGKRVDICFLVDITASMKQQVDMVRKCIQQTLDYLMPSGKQRGDNPDPYLGVRLAFAGYRDWFNTRPAEVLDFTRLKNFNTFLEGVKNGGGGGHVADVFGGIEAVGSLNWSADAVTKVLFHMADAPCHGEEYYSTDHVKVDFYPKGDPKKRDIKALLSRLRQHKCQYYFGRIGPSTEIMIEKFTELYGDKIKVFEVSDPSALFGSVKNEVVESVDRYDERRARKGGRGGAKYGEQSRKSLNVIDGSPLQGVSSSYA